VKNRIENDMQDVQDWGRKKIVQINKKISFRKFLKKARRA
jgi:hypothetical protein